MIMDLPPDLPTPPPIEQFQPAPEKPKASAFITYARDDPRFVKTVISAMNRVGIKTYQDSEFLDIGRFDHQIIATLKTVQYQIIFCTKAASKSIWCQREITFAESKRIKQVPIIIDSMDEMDWFKFMQLDLHQAIFVDGFEEENPAEFAVARALLMMLGYRY